MAYIAIMNTQGNRVAKFAEFDSEGNAQAHLSAHVERWPDAFVAEKPDAHFSEWWVDGQALTVVPVAPIIPDRVSSRQFKLALLSQGLLTNVEAWIGQQSQAVQIAYANSGTFVRDEPMMAAGFAALGFTDKQIDTFFTAAAAI